jgi:hypothetical protein
MNIKTIPDRLRIIANCGVDFKAFDDDILRAAATRIEELESEDENWKEWLRKLLE